MIKNSFKRLYRPVGIKELVKIIALDFKGFPPRLTWQPIFYPVLNQEYAEQIARDWNTKDEFSGFAGYVTAFDVPISFYEKYPVQTVGGEIHQELWIPAEDVAEMNSLIINQIKIVNAFFGEKYQPSEDVFLMNLYEEFKK